MTLSTAHVARYIAALAILVAGACTTAMNWRFSYQLGTTEWDSYTWAIFSVALDVTKWLMLPCAALAWQFHKARASAAIAIWLIATIYSFTAAIGFAALNRDTTTAQRRHQAELHKTLETMKQSPRWQSSAACADATSIQSKQFCASYREAEARLTTAAPEADPQSTILAHLTGMQPETVQLVLSIFLAAACEVISALGFFAVLAPAPKPSAIKVTPRAWKRPSWGNPSLLKRPDAARHDPAGRDASRRGTTWKSPR